ncbi:RPN7, partial [Symbiodinium microadriaticum]
MEVLDALFAKARLFAAIGDCDKAFAAYDDILAQKKISSGKKIDATLEKTRVAFFAMDKAKIKMLLGDAKKLIDAGGDWDRRNRLKVYEAYYLVSTREIRKAAEILLECVATFSCVELCSYDEFMSLTVITNIINLPRAQLRAKLVKNPQVISAMRECPHL